MEETETQESLLRHLLDEQEHNAAVFEAVPFIIALLEAHSLRVLRANAAARAVWRRALAGQAEAEGEMIGQPLYWIGEASDAGWLRADLESAAQTGQPLHALGVEFRLRNGEVRNYDWCALPLRDPSGQIARLLVISVDVTERVRAWKAAAAEQRVRDLEALNEVARAIHSARDWDACLDTLIAQIQRRRPCKIAAIAGYDARSASFQILRANRPISGFYPADGPVGLMGAFVRRAMQERQVCYVPDIEQTESSWRGRILAEGCRTALYIPLVFEGQAQGVLMLLRAAADSFSPEDIAFFEQIGTHAALALHNTALSAERQRLLDRQRRLLEIGNAINASQDLQAILRLVYEAIAQTSGFDRAALFLYDAEAQQMRGVFGTDAEGRLKDLSGTAWPLTLREETGAIAETARMLRGETPYLLCHSLGESLPEDHPLRAVGDHIEITLRARGQVLGMISMDNLRSGRPIEAADAEALLPFCEQAAAAIHRAQLQAERDQALIQAERQAHREALVNAVSRAVGSTLDPDAVLERVITEVRRLGAYLRVSITRPGEAPGEWRVAAAWNATDSPLWPPVGAIQRSTPGALQRARLSPILYYRPNAANDGGPLSDQIRALGIGSMLHIELWMDGRCLGVLNLARAGRDAFSAEEQATLEVLAPSLALALHNADLYRSLKQTQEALVRAETLRAVGELASGVAHNINNLLAAILGYAELIQSETDVPEAVTRDAQIIEKAALDGSEIVRRLQRFARQSGEEARQPTDLAAILAEALELTRARWHNEALANGTPIEVVRDLRPGLIVAGHPTELREVFVNLIRNACDAMPQGGILIVRCAASGQEALAEVADTGVGMDAATAGRVFEPFFTTKGVERGTGLGLSIAWSLVDRHGGRIEVQSAPGCGTTMRVRLSRRPSASAPAPPTGRMPLQARVLLVEDEESVREAVARSLAQSGATVQAVDSAAQALAWLQEADGICDVVIADHGMVGMTGLELLAHIRQLYPHVRRVLLSGWGATPPGGADTSAAELMLSKPVTVAALIAALRTLLTPSTTPSPPAEGMEGG
ncbi:MAG TPA: GAF domain-containing protein [Chthonomonadaceae bacterium]|nr:GAF domain-containing protein [Chthonomonadaceae bacterium]